jgi:hypothetical protein
MNGIYLGKEAAYPDGGTGTRMITLSTGGMQAVNMIRLELTPSAPSSYLPGDLVSSGIVFAIDDIGVVAASGLTPGDLYCTEGSGSYYAGPAIGQQYGFRVQLDGSTWVVGTYREKNLSGEYPTENMRDYFQVGVTGIIKIRINDSDYTDNSGFMSWKLRKASYDELYKMNIRGFSLYNICSA